MEDKENEPERVKAHGAIGKIVFHNFLTYDDVTCDPGPYLNVIIGPNGTGKSTIICGICLAVGGNPSILGRSDSFCDFIKHGKEEGFAEVHLWDTRRRRLQSFKISIKKPNSKTYFVDGALVTHKAHVEQVRKYNIQIDNPCTFLAQDKVKSFAEQNNRIMLENTERAGPEDLLVKHRELVEFFEDGDDSKDQIERNQRRLENIQATMKTVKARAKNFEEREKRTEKINLLKERKALIEFEQDADKLAESLESLDTAKKALNDARTLKTPLETRIRKMEASRRKNETIISKAKSDAIQRHAKIAELTEKSSLEEKLADNTENFNRVQRSYNEWDTNKTKIIDEMKTVDELLAKARVDNAPNPEFDNKWAELSVLKKTLSTREEQLKRQRENLHLKSTELERTRNEQRRHFSLKLQYLAQHSRNEGCKVAWDFYEKNRRKFRSEVFVPYLHMHIPLQESVNSLNNIISVRDMATFIFSCIEDEDCMMAAMKPLGIQINTTIVRDDILQEFEVSKELPTELAEMGFRDFAINLFDAPLFVRAYLCATTFLDRIPIGGQKVDDDCERIASVIGQQYGIFLSNRCRIGVTISKYNGQVSTKRSQLRPQGPLQRDIHSTQAVNLDERAKEIQRAADRNAEDTETFDDEKKEFIRNFEIYRVEERAVKNKKDQVLLLEDKLARYRARYDDATEQKPDINAARAAFDETKKILVKEAIGNVAKLAAQLDSHREAVVKGFFASEECNRMNNLITDNTSELENLIANTEDFQVAYNAKVKSHERIKKCIDERKEQLLEMVKRHSNVDPSQERININELKNKLDEKGIPNDALQIDIQMAEERERLDIGRAEGTQKDVDDYEKLKREEISVINEQEKLSSDKRDWESAMDKKLEDWLIPLQDLVNRISVNYSRFFASLGCGGEVRLDIPDDKYNVSKYGITIWVRFREGSELAPLNHQVQSGGERSVSTMLYLMALQDQCPVPFRCVDEINQGMDPDNERKVFNMMVKLLSSGSHLSKTQYFLLTPKLLGGLEFNDRVTVHIVHNGPALSNVEHWDPEKFLKRAR